MTPNKKVVITIIIGLAVAGASYYFLIYKPAHPKPIQPTTPGSNPSSNNNGIKTGGPPLPSPAPSVIGRVAYANADGVHVFNSDMSIYKTAKKGEWIGTIEAIETKGGYKYYRVSANRYVFPAYVKLG